MEEFIDRTTIDDKLVTLTLDGPHYHINIHDKETGELLPESRSIFLTLEPEDLTHIPENQKSNLRNYVAGGLALLAVALGGIAAKESGGPAAIVYLALTVAFAMGITYTFGERGYSERTLAFNETLSHYGLPELRYAR